MAPNLGGSPAGTRVRTTAVVIRCLRDGQVDRWVEGRAGRQAGRWVLQRKGPTALICIYLNIFKTILNIQNSNVQFSK